MHPGCFGRSHFNVINHDMRSSASIKMITMSVFPVKGACNDAMFAREIPSSGDHDYKIKVGPSI